MRVIGTALLLTTIMAIQVAGLDVLCEVTDDQEIVESNGKTICYFKNGIEINKPAKLRNPINKDVTEFWMKRNTDIEFLPQDLSVSFPNLETIIVNGRLVTEITRRNFYGLSMVTHINLKGNQIDTIEENSLDDLKKLTEENKITDLPGKIFVKLENLVWLDLSRNQLTELDAELFENNNKISRLNLSNNKLRTLPSGIFDGSTQLAQLDLDNNKIVDLPPHIFDNCESLRELHLSGNKIKRIDSNLLSRLGALHYAHFMSNPLDFIDFAVFDGNPSLNWVNFRDVDTADIRNIDNIDNFHQMENITIKLNGEEYGEEYHKENLDELKQFVKTRSES